YHSKRKDETALHFALSIGQLPPKTTMTDLLECSGLNKRRAIFAMFDNLEIVPRYPPELTVQHLAKIRRNNNGSLLHRAAMQGGYPNNCTVQDLMSPSDNFGRTPLHKAADFGNLLPCIKADLQSMKDNFGCTPWDVAVKNLDSFWRLERSVRNLLACPELCQKLRPNRKAHCEILKLLLASPGLTPELRGRMAVYPHICAAML
ncbi:MAG: hypothetical protein P4N59_04710, partial [Negativicutes bacterium]|nr:hypothetical protein [Negativicutes bacterium]